MDTPTSRALVLAISILASVAAGVLIGSALAREEPRSPELVSGVVRDGELVIALRALTDELERARSDRGGVSAPPAAPVRSQLGEPTAGSEIAELREATKQLAQAIDALRLDATRSGSARAPLVAPSSWPDLGAMDSLDQAEWAVRAKQYTLCSFQQMVDRLGAPEEIWPNENGTVAWIYPTPGGGRAYFTFAHGFVATSRFEPPKR